MKQTKSGTSGFRLQVLTESDHVHSDIQICSATVSLTAPVGLKELQSSEGGTADFGRRGHHLGRRRLCGLGKSPPWGSSAGASLAAAAFPAGASGVSAPPSGSPAAKSVAVVRQVRILDCLCHSPRTGICGVALQQ